MICANCKKSWTDAGDHNNGPDRDRCEPTIPLSEHQRLQAEAAREKERLENVASGLAASHAELRAERDSLLADCAAMRGALDLAAPHHQGGHSKVGAAIRSALSSSAGAALLAERDELRRQIDEIALASGFGERPEGQGGVHRPEDLAQAIRDLTREHEREIDRRGAYVDAWDEFFRAQKTIDWSASAALREAKAIQKAREAWERDTNPEDR